MFIDDRTLLTQTVHFGIIVKDAKRTTKIQIYLRSYRPNSLGWTKPFCTVLQIIELKTLPPALCALAPISSKDVSSCRPFSCSHIRHSSRHWKNSEYSITHSQRSHPSDSGPAQLSSSGHLKDFPLEIQLAKPPKSPTSTRQISDRNIPSSWATLFCHHRCGYDSVDCFWTSGVSPDGLQSQIPWETFLCSTNLQRRQNRFLSITGVKTWQCPSFKRGMDILRTHHRKIAQHYGFLQNPHSSGCILLQWKDSTTFRREKYRICHCCQNVKTTEVANCLFPLPRICQRLGSNRIYFPSVKFQKGASFYCYKTTKSLGTRRSSKKPFHIQKLCLSQSFSNQSGSYSRRCLAILLQQGLSRTFTSGVQKFFFHGSNSNPQLPGKCHLYGDHSLGIRYCLSLSKLLSARKITTLEYFNTSQRTLVATSRVGQAWQLQYVTAPKTISTAGFVFQDSKSNFSCQTSDLNQFANTLIYQSDEKYQKNSVYSRFSGRCCEIYYYTI